MFLPVMQVLRTTCAQPQSARIETTVTRQKSQSPWTAHADQLACRLLIHDLCQQTFFSAFLLSISLFYQAQYVYRVAWCASLTFIYIT